MVRIKFDEEGVAKRNPKGSVTSISPVTEVKKVR
jgi:hypothetical protein